MDIALSSPVAGMGAPVMVATPAVVAPPKKPVSWKNLAIGAVIQVFEVSTLGQPFEVLKTHMAGRQRWLG